MVVDELKKENKYNFELNISKRQIKKNIKEYDIYDEWGCAFLSIGKKISVEYNLCVDNTTDESINSSAIYKVNYNEDEDCIETDYDKYIHYEVDFNKRGWKKELENAMCEALIKFFEL